MIDLLIIGTGPAGVSAALTAQARRMDFALLGSARLSPKVRKAERIDNYPGLPQVSGEQMQKVLLDQLAQAEITVHDERINTIMAMGETFMAASAEGMYEARAVLLTTGVQTGRAIPGEEALLGKGVSYCATCDGALYRGKTVAVLCTSQDFAGEVEFLAKMAAQVYLFGPVEGDFGDNVQRCPGLPMAIAGEDRVSGVTYRDGELAVDGIFLLRDSQSPASLLPGLALTADGHIAVDRAQRTNLRGVYAAGDCTGRPYQYAKAVGEGNVAVHSILEDLRQQRK